MNKLLVLFMCIGLIAMTVAAPQGAPNGVNVIDADQQISVVDDGNQVNVVDGQQGPNIQPRDGPGPN